MIPSPGRNSKTATYLASAGWASAGGGNTMTFEISDISAARAGGDARRRLASLADLDPRHLALLDRPLVACFAATRAKGPPHLSAVWVMHDDTHLYVNTARGRVKDRLVRRRPDVSLMVVDPEDTSHWISVEGRVDEIIDEDDPKRGHLATDSIDALSEMYVGVRPYRYRASKEEVRVRLRIQPTHIVTFGPLRR